MLSNMLFLPLHYMGLVGCSRRVMEYGSGWMKYVGVGGVSMGVLWVCGMGSVMVGGGV